MTKNPRDLSRRHVLGGALGLAGAAGLNLPALAQVAKPKSPLSINIIDAAGNLALTQPAFDNYRKANPDLISRMTFTKAPSPELPGKIRAQQSANRVDIDLVIIGPDALSAGLADDIYLNVVEEHRKSLPDLQAIYLDPAWRMQELAKGRGVVVSYYPSGPLLEYAPDRVKTPPTTAEELLAWAKQNPKKFIYARPANSGPGRTFLMGLPYLLGDSNPKDPMKGWDKTWAYLKELNSAIEYYPAGTTATMKEFGDGTRDMLVTTTGWDINPRVLGIVPKEAKVASLKGFHWVVDAHYLSIPKGVAAERIPVLVDLIGHMLKKDQQAYAYDEGYFYPGPAVKDVPLSMAPQSSQDAIREYGRPEYEKLIADNPKELPLEPEQLVQAFRRWDEEIGSKK
ncbi:extracellular solute-binding protein [Microvirga pudoricolor]|uniref:extracellular solute-binding protein n=1 Tax=Microvirga pudoricolor TaxID=2778729 RepID=UPI001950A0C1|nr:extracellular solute-binding protein [Microvirga pudoricolor]MBM6593147.1 extracellular solute-binding protein [Microvirga pudoricolor]